MDKNSQINTSGILGGLFFVTAIPGIYSIVRFFGSIGLVKKNAKNWGLGLVALLSFLFGIIALIYGVSSIFVDIQVNISTGINDYVTIFRDFAISDSARNAITFGLISLFLGWIFSIATGLSVKSYLDSSESSSLTPEERFKIAKYAGIFLYYIPLYFVIKVFMTYGDIKDIDSSTAVFNLVTIILYIVVWILAYSISPLLFIILWILCLVAGSKENKLFENKI